MGLSYKQVFWIYSLCLYGMQPTYYITYILSFCHWQYIIIFVWITVWKMSEYGDISVPYFSVIRLNTGKYRPEITLYLDTFHAVHFSLSIYLAHVLFFCLDFLSRILTIYRTQVKREAISLAPLCHFHPFHSDQNISRTITPEITFAHG